MFVAYLLARNIRYEEDVVDQLFNSSEKRLARLLLMLAHFGKEGVPEPVVPKISQETLAEMVGTTRSRVSFFMNRFRKVGFFSMRPTRPVSVAARVDSGNLLSHTDLGNSVGVGACCDLPDGHRSRCQGDCFDPFWSARGWNGGQYYSAAGDRQQG
jgi:hypothetical protein